MSVYSAAELENLNYEYSPSNHTKRYKTADEAIQGHFQIIEKETYKVQNECQFLIDFNIKYGTDEDEVLDVYYKKTTAKNAPLFVYIHGGYWQILTKDTSAFCVEPLVNAGYRVLIVNYSLCPKKPLTHLIHQIQNFIKFCVAYGIERDSESISLCGHSAGGHLILSGLSDNLFWKDLPNKKLLKHIYLVSGVFDLSEIRYLSSINNNNILGLNDQNIKEVSPLFSNYSHLKPYDIKFHIFVGEYDSKIFQKHSKVISEHLKSDINETCCSYKILEGIDHFDIVENLRFSEFCITKKIIKMQKFIGNT